MMIMIRVMIVWKKTVSMEMLVIIRKQMVIMLLNESAPLIVGKSLLGVLRDLIFFFRFHSNLTH